MLRYLVASTLSAIAMTAGVASAVGQDWGCYDPQPGHPTAAEKVQFVAEVSKDAVLAEQSYGVPAAAIAAMSIAESGYGWTRTALEANNLFGYKYVSSTAAGGRGYYELKCQPDGDPGNRYIVFRDRADAINFVAGKLATLAAYKADTDKYKVDRLVDGRAAITRWVAGIADPYNSDPRRYTSTIVQIMNNPNRPSDTVSGDNLYALSTPAQPSATAPTGDALAYAKSHAVVWTGRCRSVEDNIPGWDGFPVRKCEYTDIGVKVETFMLNADKEKLAHWYVTACADAKVVDMHACIDALVKASDIAASGNIFPVAGYIPEPAGKTAGYCYYFRDGVTAGTPSYPKWQAPSNGKCPISVDQLNAEPATVAYAYARIASADRSDYIAAGGVEDVEGVRWLSVVRKLYQRAWNSERNELISMVAKRLKRNGMIN